jgi:hypothetical protein
VMVELTEHKRTGRLTGGKVKEVLTTAPIHPHCWKDQTDYLNSAVNHINQTFKKLTNFEFCGTLLHSGFLFINSIF